MHSSRMCTARSLPYGARGSLSRKVSVQGVSVQGGLCSRGLCPAGSGWASVQGSLSIEDLCLGGLCPVEVSVQRVSVQRGSLSGTPDKILPCAKLRLWPVRKENVYNPKRKYNM